MNANAVLPAYDAWIIIGAFSVLWVLIGWWLGRNNNSLEDYMLAGRKVGMGFAVATAMATWVTSNTTMTAPQLTYQLGIWGMVGYSLGAVGLILFAPLARRIRTLMPQGYTSGDFIRLRYGRTAWRVFLGISFFYSLGWLISLGMAGGLLINALSGIPYAYGMTVIVAICTLYTVFGGLKAVIGTDFIQTILILVGVVALGVLVVDEVGFETIHASLSEERPELLNMLLPASIMFLFNNLFFGVGEIFHSNVWWSRAFAFAPGVGFRAYLTAGVFWLPIPIVAGLIALAAPALGINVPSPDMVAPLVAGKLFGLFGGILVFVVVFAALASSLDSVLAATSDLIVKDIYKGHIRPAASDAELRKAAVWIIIGLGATTWALSLMRLATLGSLLHFTGAFVASTIWPIAVGLLYKRGNGVHATAAMLLGSVGGLAAYFTIGFYVAALVSAGISMAVMALAFLQRPSFDWANLTAARQSSTGDLS
ncbi:sodium:solute symporter family protein [Gimibacter soli]|uniref:Sodium:solute symporter family protein n=1 Tax=Gimibacter soli TaxID=3024400 RepID=A0AAE9XVP3_9PROT|nr:sodium:solute symporter family protein [Gimibacter soli]WCL53859.1 sodium:solute symporter family protein [Gimibacter soli]